MGNKGVNILIVIVITVIIMILRLRVGVWLHVESAPRRAPTSLSPKCIDRRWESTLSYSLAKSPHANLNIACEHESLATQPLGQTTPDEYDVPLGNYVQVHPEARDHEATPQESS